jgi:hypothetical protein
MRKALGFVLRPEAQEKDGYFGQNDGSRMYGHGITTLMLSEMLGMGADAAQDEVIRNKCRLAIDLILRSQKVSKNDSNRGGWRYSPDSGDSDMSVTVWQTMALRAAKNSGLDVPQATIDRAVGYVKACQHPASGGFAYQPGRDPGYARTAAAIYSLQVCGLYDDPMVKKVSEYLFKNYSRNEQWFTYGNFYAAPAQYMIGGDTWAKWYAQLKDVLLKNVTSLREDMYYWEPKLDAGGGGVGPTFSTAVYTMILAMPYHYIPLYQR